LQLQLLMSQDKELNYQDQVKPTKIAGTEQVFREAVSPNTADNYCTRTALYYTQGSPGSSAGLVT